MPSTMTHAYMASDIYERLNLDIKKKFTSKLEEYKTYSQGPDLFYFYRILFPFGYFLHIQEFGGRVHREKVNELFITLTDIVKKTKNINQFIFLCGLLTHYLGDTTCHPLINYKADFLRKKTKKKKDYHFIIETYIDNYVLNLKGQDYKKFSIHKFAFNAKKQDDVENLLNDAFYRVFKEKNIGIIYYKCLNDMKLFFHFFRYDPYKIKKVGYNILFIFIRFISRDIRYLSYNFNLTKEDDEFYLNLNHKLWYNVKKKENTSQKTFMELYDKVVKEGVKKIEKLYEYIYQDKPLNLESFYGNLSYANGLPLKK